ncbi:hypothetical protein QWY77_03530 [Thalassotalea ponticola]|uniref:hypothetical protein n=1 Tax=Thalassotalea ponticola TaxID=1523392 RepID=UPI0025B56225|nr:hypothetical protein [Thalassotalea ponticola]MDN3651837.1 hypothetical protein [Thalassotalea ponticola]
MKYLIVVLTFLMLLTACEDSKKVADQMTDAAKDAAQSVTDYVDSIDFSQFGEAADQAKDLATSIQEAVSVDMNDSDAVESVKNSIANAYNCFAGSTSDEEATDFVTMLIDKIKNEDIVSLINQAIENAATIGECMTQ